MKYTSGLSLDDNISNIEDDEFNIQNETKNSINQLARETRIVYQKESHKKKMLLFITHRNYCKEVYEDIL